MREGAACLLIRRQKSDGAEPSYEGHRKMLVHGKGGGGGARHGPSSGVPTRQAVCLRCAPLCDLCADDSARTGLVLSLDPLSVLLGGRDCAVCTRGRKLSDIAAAIIESHLLLLPPAPAAPQPAAAPPATLPA
jgi:hypothetical protein